jgi:hypothetical protein
MYRLAADIFNDTAMILDCLSPAFPTYPRVAVLALSSALRALCGVCAGATKASLSGHFAKRGNLGEVNAVSFAPSLSTLCFDGRPPNFSAVRDDVLRRYRVPPCFIRKRLGFH